MPQRLVAGSECPLACRPLAGVGAHSLYEGPPKFEGGGLAGLQLLGICHIGGAPALPHRISDHLRNVSIGDDAVVAPEGAPRLFPHRPGHQVRVNHQPHGPRGVATKCSPSCRELAIPTTSKRLRFLTGRAMGRASSRDCGR